MLFVELPKLKGKEIDLNDKLERWLRFINAESEEELAMLEKENDNTLNNAIQVVRYMSADDNARYLADMREKAEYDYYAGLTRAREKGLAEGEAIGIAKGKADIISQLRDLNVSEEIIAALEKDDKNN